MKDVVSAMVEEWLAERATRSLSQLSKSSGVGETTLRRIQTGSSRPALETIIDLGRATGKHQQMLSAIEKHYPDSLNFITRMGMSAGPSIESNGENFFDSSQSTAIFLSLFAHGGLSLSNVVEKYGKSGLDVVNKLVDAGLAIRKDEFNVSPVERWYSYKSPQEVLQVIRSLTQDFDTSDLGGPFARLGVLTEKLNKKGAEKVRTLLAEAMSDIRAVMDDPDSLGDEVVAVSALMKRVK